MPSEFVEIAFNLPLDRAFTYRNLEDKPAKPGCRAEAWFGRRKLSGFVLAERSEAPEGVPEIKPILRAIDEEPIFTPELASLARWMAGTYFSSTGEALAAMLPGGRREMEYPAFGLDELELVENPLELSLEQAGALEAILAEPGEGSMFYLFGVTGSGKTEVFLRAASKLMESGRSVIYLVPEIALTRQVVEAVTGRFGPSCAVIHSGLTPSQKLSQWRSIMKGEARIVVGARSAVFAPVVNLGLVVIDEEHEGSYKAGNAPRYHARQVAMKRCAENGARLVMGSATPSAEAFSLMGEGRIRRLDLSARISGGAMPKVEIVSMAGERGCISKRLIEEIKAAKAAGRQTILFLNRRGFSYFFHCKSCGYELVCRNCSVSLTYHKERNRVVCHYCGYSSHPPNVCPECGSLDVGYSGFGTEMIEEEVRRLFPEMSVKRVDTDSVKEKGSLDETLAAFRAGTIDILLGTQMVAKGLNFPGVRLVGVVFADSSLHLPDFRAAERTFSLIVQVAGRAGRYFPDGKVIVQTLRPENPAVKLACAYDIEGFFKYELAMRKEAGFPPYSRLIRLVFRSKEHGKAEAAAEEFARLVAAELPSEAEILGPAECPIGMISGNSRYQIIFRAPEMNALHAAVRSAYAGFVAPNGVYIEVDVDPVSLL